MDFANGQADGRTEGDAAVRRRTAPEGVQQVAEACFFGGVELRGVGVRQCQLNRISGECRGVMNGRVASEWRIANTEWWTANVEERITNGGWMIVLNE